MIPRKLCVVHFGQRKTPALHGIRIHFVKDYSPESCIKWCLAKGEVLQSIPGARSITYFSTRGFLPQARTILSTKFKIMHIAQPIFVADSPIKVVREQSHRGIGPKSAGLVQDPSVGGQCTLIPLFLMSYEKLPLSHVYPRLVEN